MDEIMREPSVHPTNTGLAGDEAELVELARTGDEWATRAIIQKYNLRLFRVARAIVNNDAEAEDALQDAYLKAFTSLNSFRGAARFSTWLTRIVINEALGRLRQQRPNTSMESAGESELQRGAQIMQFPIMGEDANPEAAAARRQVRQLLEQAIDELPDPFRLVFVMRDIEGMSTEETASGLDLKPETVKTRLFRARRLMRALLQERLVASLAAAFPFGGRRCARMADAVVARLAVSDSDRFV